MHGSELSSKLELEADDDDDDDRESLHPSDSVVDTRYQANLRSFGLLVATFLAVRDPICNPCTLRLHPVGSRPRSTRGIPIRPPRVFHYPTLRVCVFLQSIEAQSQSPRNPEMPETRIESGSGVGVARRQPCWCLLVCWCVDR